MSPEKIETGFAEINGARIYYEVAGEGQPLVMIHAGVADHRQWNNEFAYFARSHRVVRYDLRGYGRSEPVEGEYRLTDDLAALLDLLGIRQPAVLMGCSMGGGLAIDFALAHPSRARALILVGSAVGGLELDVPRPEKSAEAEEAYEAGDLERVAELETQIWFDGEGRTPGQVDPAMRALALEMNRRALQLEARQLGKRLPDGESPAAARMSELTLPILIVVGEYDTAFIRTAADYMAERIPSAHKVVMADAAHLANMDHPDRFREILGSFLEESLA